MILSLKDLVQGKMYFISYGGNTQLIFRFKSYAGEAITYFDALLYESGYETFIYINDYCLLKNVSELRPATKAEKHTLIKFEIQYDCI